MVLSSHKTWTWLVPWLIRFEAYLHTYVLLGAFSTAFFHLIGHYLTKWSSRPNSQVFCVYIRGWCDPGQVRVSQSHCCCLCPVIDSHPPAKREQPSCDVFEDATGFPWWNKEKCLDLIHQMTQCIRNTGFSGSRFNVGTTGPQHCNIRMRKWKYWCISSGRWT